MAVRRGSSVVIELGGSGIRKADAMDIVFRIATTLFEG
jgi:hypothetical protein